MAPIEYKPGKRGTSDFNPGVTQLRPRSVYFDYVATQVYVGSIVQYKAAADPRDGFVVGPGWDVEVLAAVTDVGKAKIAGVVTDLGGTAGTADGWITLVRPTLGDIVTLAVAVAIDTGDGCKLANSGAYCDDSGTYAVTDVALCLYDEDDTNNPHGADAISASIGLIEAIWTQADQAATA